METIWFCIVAVMLTVYVLRDGFDLGVGAILLFTARNDKERRALIGSTGPVWGNEVWLLAAGGALYFAFPGIYASGFSGFYLALIMILWLLILRGISIGFRSHLRSNLWRPFWDVVLCGASTVLAIFYGAALGDVVRGAPLDKDGYFSLPLWTNFTIGSRPLIDWYTLLIGVAALSMVTMHGALWAALKTTGELRFRARRVASRIYWVAAAMTFVISIASFAVQPHLAESFSARPWLWIFPLIATTGLFSIPFCLSAGLDLGTFLGSCVSIAGLLCSAAFGIYPTLLHSLPPAGPGLTVFNAPPYELTTGLNWWIPGFILAVTYTVIVYWHFRGAPVSNGESVAATHLIPVGSLSRRAPVSNLYAETSI